jgi:hypothetical protein
LGRQAFEAEHSGNKPLAQNLRWQAAGAVDDAIKASGGQPYAQQGLQDRGFGPVENAGSPKAQTLGGGAEGAEDPGLAKTLPAGGSFTPPGAGGQTLPQGNSPTLSGTPCTGPCGPTGTQQMVGLGGAIGALGGS